MLDWLAFGVVQAIFASCVVALLFADRNDRPYLSRVLISLGGLLLLINVGWYFSGGMEGRYAAHMRGGMQGSGSARSSLQR